MDSMRQSPLADEPSAPTSEQSDTPTSDDDAMAIFDVETCTTLHNRIVHYGIEKMKEHGVYGITPTRGWFSYWRDRDNQSAERLREFLTDEMVKFLDGIDIVDEEQLAFLPQLRSIALPFEMAEADQDIFSDAFSDEGYCCINLYASPGCSNGEDERGLIMNINDHFVSYFDSLYDGVDRKDNTYGWIPFQDALTYYWRLVKAGKFTIGPDPDNGDKLGWIMAEYCTADLETTLEAWEMYCSLLSVRTSQPDDRPTVVGWFEPAQLDDARVQGFAREFLLKARRPPVRFVAPGLTTMDADLLRRAGETNQAVFERDLHEEIRYPLFPTARPSDDLPHSIGLFLRQTRFEPRQRYGDAAELVLPWAAGGLFTHGICPVMKDHPVRLEMVIRKWSELLDAGVWTVGPDGVEGGIEHWDRFGDATERARLEVPHECASTAIRPD